MHMPGLDGLELAQGIHALGAKMAAGAVQLVRAPRGGSQLFDAGLRRGHTVARGQGKDQLGLERAFNVDMQLSLGHGAQVLAHALWVHRGPREMS